MQVLIGLWTGQHGLAGVVAVGRNSKDDPIDYGNRKIRGHVVVVVGHTLAPFAVGAGHVPIPSWMVIELEGSLVFDVVALLPPANLPKERFWTSKISIRLPWLR